MTAGRPGDRRKAVHGEGAELTGELQGAAAALLLVYAGDRMVAGVVGVISVPRLIANRRVAGKYA